MLSVGSIARVLGVNRYKLLRSFKKEREITLEKYIGRLKIIQSVLLLKGKEYLTVKEIGEIVGYNSYNYFISIFKRYIGTTPGKFRELTSGDISAVEKDSF